MDESNWNIVLLYLHLAPANLDDVAKASWSGVVFVDSCAAWRLVHFL
jgi:hypothetical protein